MIGFCWLNLNACLVGGYEYPKVPKVRILRVYFTRKPYSYGETLDPLSYSYSYPEKHYRSGKIETTTILSYPSLLPTPIILLLHPYTPCHFAILITANQQSPNKETRNPNLHFATLKTLCLMTRDRPHLQQTNHPHPREPTHPDKAHKHARFCSIKSNLDAILLNKLSSPFAPEWAS